MPTTAVVWFRNDLRVHDHPALHEAAAHADSVIPLFIRDDRLLGVSPNRTAFLAECLDDLRDSLAKLGSDLVVRRGDPRRVLRELADESGATTVYATEDVSPYAVHRDRRVRESLRDLDVRTLPGRFAVDDLRTVRTGSDGVYQVFTPFWRSWRAVPRRPVLRPDALPPVPPGLARESAPGAPTGSGSPHRARGGETAARDRLHRFLAEHLDTYDELHDDLAADATSRLSAYLHFGCLSVREIESMLGEGEGSAAFHRQLAWRDFCHYILLHFPRTTREPFQERYGRLTWEDDQPGLDAWRAGRTGFPIVDAAMRQLLAEGFMHNRARLIVGSFLTKDLGLDWRHGERHFMEWLIDGDTANNVTNWQWITSIGVDPAPLFRRLYNPAAQLRSYDPQGIYVKRYVPELAGVPPKHLAAPWAMTPEEQRRYGCVIGEDYPAAILDHALAREATLARYRAATARP